jgi:predicted dehydrogenase
MKKKHSFIIVGTGGMGTRWCRDSLPPLVQAGRIEPAAAVDISPEALHNAQKYLGVSAAQCFTSMDEAFDAVRADFAVIVVPPAFHEQVVDLALAHDMDILSEKPIADTMDASVRVLKKVERAAKRMGVTMSHRYDADKVTFRDVLTSGRVGRLDYIVSRFTCANRKFGEWGEFRYRIPDPLLIEGSVHHLDILRSFAADDCGRLYARTWNPPWGEFEGDSCGLVTMEMQRGVKCFYEGAKTNAYGLNCWEEEYFRAECEFGTLILDHRQIELWQEGKEPEKIPLATRHNWKNEWLAEQFVDWLDGGLPMDTRVEDNIQAAALVFGSIESSRRSEAIDVQSYLQEKLASVTVQTGGVA